MRKTNVRWQKRAAALLVLCAAGLLSACNDDPAAEPPSLTEEHGLQVAAVHFHEYSRLTPEESAERGFRYCRVSGGFFVAIRSRSGTLPKEMTATVLAAKAPGLAPVPLEVEVVGVEAVNTTDVSWRQMFGDQKMPAREDRLHVRGFVCAADDSLTKNSRLDLTLTLRSGEREATLSGYSDIAGDAGW